MSEFCMARRIFCICKCNAPYTVHLSAASSVLELNSQPFSVPKYVGMTPFDRRSVAFCSRNGSSNPM